MKNVIKNLIAFASVLSIVACTSGSKSSSSAGGGSATAQKFLKGRAAKGAYLPQGAVVQVRTGSGTVSSTTVSDSTGDFTFDITGATGPFLVRGCDGDCTNGGTWYYSYSGSSPLQNTIGVKADVSGSLNSTYFLISAINNSTQAEDDFYVWENVGGNGVDPAISGRTGIEVNVAQNVTAAANATAIAAALSAQTSDFATAYVDTTGTNVIVLNNLAGSIPEATDGTASTGFTFSSQDSNVANVNPYTDMMIRGWYNDLCVVGSASGQFNIDDLFISGVYPSGTPVCVNGNQGMPGFLPGQNGTTLPDNSPIDLPNETAILEVSALMSNVISNIYGIDIQNALMVNWVQGEGFDALLDSVGKNQIEYQLFASNVLASAWDNPNWLSNAIAYNEVIVSQTGSQVTGKSYLLHADFWTTQTDDVALRINMAGNYLSVHTPTLQSDSTSTSFHYTLDYPYTQNVLNDLVYDSVDMMLANNTYIESALPVVSYATGTAYTATYPGFPSIAAQEWPWTLGQGASVTSISGDNVTFTIPDLTPASVTVTDSNGNVLNTTTYNTVNPWVGTSGTVALSNVPASFTLAIVGTNGARTSVNYQQ